MIKRFATLSFALLVIVTSFAADVWAKSAAGIDADVDQTLHRFYNEISGGEKLVKDAKGVLVFPAVYKAGIGLGGEYGEGSLRIKGKTVDYYNSAAGSIGLQLGVQKKSIIILFMDQKALERFRDSSGWKAGVDASIAVVSVGAGGAIDTAQLKKPILGFVFNQAGLMYNLTLEGAKFTKIKK